MQKVVLIFLRQTAVLFKGLTKKKIDIILGIR